MKYLLSAFVLLLSVNLIFAQEQSKDSTFIKPRLTLTTQAYYVNCTSVILSANYSVDSVMLGDSICWLIEDGRLPGKFSPNYSKSGGFSDRNISIPNIKAGSYPITLKYLRRAKETLITKENAYTLRYLPQASFEIDINKDSIYAPAIIKFNNKTI